MAGKKSALTGSGKFVPVRVWSCPVHKYPMSDEYEDWEAPGEVCLDCEVGVWRDNKDENGEIVMRELSSIEEMLMRAPFSNPMSGDLAIWEELHSQWRADWLEDPLIPLTLKAQ